MACPGPLWSPTRDTSYFARIVLGRDMSRWGIARFRHQHAPAALSRKTETAPSLLRRTTADDPSSLTGDAPPPKRFAFRYCPVTRENSGCCPSSSLSTAPASKHQDVPVGRVVRAAYLNRYLLPTGDQSLGCTLLSRTYLR